MLDNKTIYALVPARGGSKGIPRKNLALVGDKSLVGRAISCARGSKYVDRILVSSDDEEILAEANRHGVVMRIERPSNLASDTATTSSVVLHSLNTLETKPDYLVLIQPTSPFVSSLDIDLCIEKCLKEYRSACVSVVAAQAYPEFMFRINDKGDMQSVLKEKTFNTRRQDLTQVYVPNGAVYVVSTAQFEQNMTFFPADVGAHIMPRERSIDIDEPFDLDLANFILARGT